MKRDILFKGKIKRTNEWVEGYLIQYDDKTQIGKLQYSDVMIFIKVKPETVGQYTGITDCNDIKIFEGDILREEHPTHNNKYVVRWSEGNCGFVAEPMKPDKIWPNLNPGSTRHLKIIGNIHDNAE